MWATSQGDRTLVGCEAQLVAHAVRYLRDMITAAVDTDASYSSQVVLFNSLRPNQQLAILNEVAQGLLDLATPVPELTSIREATVHALYRELITLVEIEIDLGSLDEDMIFNTRLGIRLACDQISKFPNQWSDGFIFDDPNAYHPPESDCEDVEEWSLAVEFLADQVLWDRDFEMEPIFADHDPRRLGEIKERLGIEPDYFCLPAPDPNSEEYLRLDRELIELTSSLVPRIKPFRDDGPEFNY